MLSRLLRGLADLFYPRVCLGCRKKTGGAREEDFLCASCLGKIEKNLPPFCFSCGRQLKNKISYINLCPACQRTRVHFDRAFSPLLYSGITKEMIHELKYKNKDFLAPYLCRFMSDFIREFNLPVESLDYIIPIPLHKAKLREREFNQAQLLAQPIAKEFKKELLIDALIRAKNTRTQTELQIDKRFGNVKGSFIVGEKTDLKGKNILLIDDVLTTGATSSEAASALKEAGAHLVFVLTLAN